MLNSYKEITNRYLKHSKKRTILTIIGIILSVALISTIGLFIKAMQLGQIEKMKAQYGSFHMMYMNPSEEFISKIENNTKVNRYGLFKQEKEEKIMDKFRLSEMKGTDRALELMPYKIKKGSYPEKQGEVAIQEWALKKLNTTAKIGEKIKINDKEYVLSGVLENKLGDQDQNLITILTKVDKIDGERSLILDVKDKANLKSAIKDLEELGDKYKVQHQMNVYVLCMYGIGEGDAITGLLKLAAVVIGIVVISSIIVIYNSFNISVVERIKQFGLLRAIGMTPKQIRTMVLREASILGVIGVPIGLIFGVIAMYCIKFVFTLIGAEDIAALKVEISPTVMAISAGVGLVSIYISALLPAFFAGRVSPLVAISSRATITKEKIKRKKATFAKKLLGFEGMMAVKNMKRNRKRYRSTVLSIVISVVLFVTFNYFMNLSLTINGTDTEGTKMDLTLRYDNSMEVQPEGFAINDKIINEIKNSKDVEKVYNRYEGKKINALIDKDKELGELKDFEVYSNTNVNGKEGTVLEAIVQPYDDNLLEITKKYVTSGSIDIDNLKSSNGVILIENVSVYSEKLKKMYRGKIADLKVGDEITLKEDNEFSKGELKKVKIVAIVRDFPFNSMRSARGVNIISNNEVYKTLTGVKEIKTTQLDILIKKGANTEAVVDNINKIIDNAPELKLINNMDANKMLKTAVLMVQILVYGFIVVVALIGVVNIINTITTNIILRKREFASLKAIGLTQRSLKKTIILEGICYGVMGTLYGSIVSSGLCYFIYRSVSDNIKKTMWEMPWSAIAISGFAAIIIGYLATLSPLARINKENLIETIREDI